jgi:hypothetical protein
MSAGTAGQPLAKHEDFPVASLRYMEGKLGKIRRVVMDVSATIAEQSSADMGACRVEPIHVDQALLKLFREFPRFRNEIGLVE